MQVECFQQQASNIIFKNLLSIFKLLNGNITILELVYGGYI